MREFRSAQFRSVYPATKVPFTPVKGPSLLLTGDFDQTDIFFKMARSLSDNARTNSRRLDMPRTFGGYRLLFKRVTETLPLG